MKKRHKRIKAETSGSDHDRQVTAFAARFVIAVLAFFSVFSEILHAEYIFLKDGSVTEGRILSETPATMTVSVKNGNITVMGRKDVLRVQYTQLYMGKLYIQKTDGSVVEAFIVDEDQEHYIARFSFDSPKEFIIRRNDVLFMTRKNPSSLECKIDYKHVDLSWRQPYTPGIKVRHYNVYLKTKGGGYAVVGRTGRTSFRIRGLFCNTEYDSMVTAVDETGYESLPSNDVHFATRKGRPLPPRYVRATGVTSDASGVCTAHLAWDRALDPCGGIVSSYNIYLKDPDGAGLKRGQNNRFPGYRLAGTTSKTSFIMPGLKDMTRYRVIITSIDNTKDESRSGAGTSFSTDNIPPQYPYPLECRKIAGGHSRGVTVRLRWRSASDRDGSVPLYRVYRKDKEGYVPVGTTEKTTFEIEERDAGVQQRYVVRSVDNRGDESADSYPASIGLIRYVSITARGAALVPLGSCARLYGPGYGGILAVSAENLFFNGIGIGAESGYFYLGGRSEVTRGTSMVPFALIAYWRFELARWFAIAPVLGIGGCSIRASTGAYDMLPLEISFISPYVTRTSTELMLQAGVNMEWVIAKTALIRIGVSYRGLAEQGGFVNFAEMYCGAGVRF